jgi:hypothetical protein
MQNFETTSYCMNRANKAYWKVTLLLEVEALRISCVRKIFSKRTLVSTFDFYRCEPASF